MKNERINFTAKVCAVFCLFIFSGVSWWLLADLRYYSIDIPAFSLWQIPLLIIFVLVGLNFFIYYSWQGKILQLMLVTLLYALIIIFVPYQNYGDFKLLRDISFCEQDGRLCRENLYPYLTKDWCVQNGYVFDVVSRYCKMRID